MCPWTDPIAHIHKLDPFTCTILESERKIYCKPVFMEYQATQKIEVLEHKWHITTLHRLSNACYNIIFLPVILRHLCSNPSKQRSKNTTEYCLIIDSPKSANG